MPRRSAANKVAIAAALSLRPGVRIRMFRWSSTKGTMRWLGTLSSNASSGLSSADASLGLALSRLGKHAEAIPHLRKALELDDDGSLHFQLANAYRAAGRLRDAIGAYKHALADRERVQGPDHPDTLTARANLADT